MSSGFPLLALALAAGSGAVLSLACDDTRKGECVKFLAAVKPLDEGTPSLETVQRVQKDLAATTFKDTPLDV